jgi:beta-1,4-N-acetylglucosaminyltransferase
MNVTPKIQETPKLAETRNRSGDSTVDSRDPRNELPKLCLVCSRGGHLMQLLKLEQVFAHRPHFLITTAGTSQIEELSRFSKVYFVSDINEWRWLENPFKFVWATIQTLKLFIAERPDFVLSTGSAIAVPAFLLARLYGAKSIYVEDSARVRAPSRAGRACYRLGHLFLTSHPELCKKYPRAVYKGALCEHLNLVP